VGFGIVVAAGDESGDEGIGLVVSNGVCWRIRGFDTVHLLVFQEIIKTTQIGRFDGHVRRRRHLAAVARQGDHGLGRERLLLSQETTQRIVHRRLAVVGGVLQNPQVGPASDFGSVFVVEPVVGDAKAAGGE
jgi:hypothetical protein